MKKHRKFQKPPESDVDRVHRLFTGIVRKHALGDTRGFARALAFRLHTMRMTPSVLLTPEGHDAVEAIAMALEDWRQLADNRSQQLPKVWLAALVAIGAWTDMQAALRDLQSRDVRRHWPTTPTRFTNGIKIR